MQLGKSEATIMNRFDAQDALMETHHAKTTDLHDHVRESAWRKLLDALAYSEMNERRNMIEKRVRDFGETYTWIFKCPACVHHSPHDACMPSNFVQWLYGSTKIFWISGKPGSGKSQLMDFIYLSLNSNGPTFVPLEEWERPKPVHVLDFWFFKPATSVLLKTNQGFWRSLCFQILDKDKGLVQKVDHTGTNMAPESLKSSLRSSGTTFRSWTDRELSSWLTYLLSVSEHNYLLLLDGLDENTDDHEGLLETIHCLARNSGNIKICCSSRPEPLFVQSLGHCPMLRLQDLNFADIESYCSKRLDNTRAAAHASDIAMRAEGVFLWAYLVAEDLRRGSLQGDSDKDLGQRLSDTPTEMNDLFEFMLKRQDRFYLKHPKPYLPLLDAAVQISAYPSLLQLLLASRELDVISSQVINGPDTELLTELDESARNLETNVVANCAGLVEIERDLDRMEAVYEHLVEASGVGLKFIHRCVQDFLLESEVGAHFLQSCNVPREDATKRLMTASALGYILSTKSIFFAEALDYAEHIVPESWTPSETNILDSLFSAMYSRLKAGQEEADSSILLECPQLSEMENLAFGHAAYRRMIPYLQAKMAVTDLEKTTPAAGLIVSAIVRHHSELSDDMAKMLQPYISWTQYISLRYFVDHKGPLIPVSLPLWQHYFIGRLNTKECFHDGFRAKSRNNCLDLDIRSILLDNSNCSRPAMSAFFIAAPYGEFLPDPGNKDADESLLHYEAFKGKMTVPESGGFDWRLVNFKQYSPEGLRRFVKIQPKMEDSPQYDEFREGYAVVGADEQAYYEYTTNILNDNIPILSPAEIADVICIGMRYLFSNGRFRHATWDALEQWLKCISNGKFSEDFSSERDPVLLKILKRESDKTLSGSPTDFGNKQMKHDL
ncbi:hypothetical protein, variant [Exophiala oligosperma]|uniref:NACHT domain-containing protein n=1 Tax=Exophiala oligosperma TaxID=215243 RepID=A0A0D2E2Z0_9EURO|nr:uncharacterized protein PV06_05726 [Exophiala oligosperma]XP_016262360.1 hypothetical protein, variant [Exophiala oligosperma]KIW42143.1 hypothetical protein PV06_05726 [Exophiala oligosperma]KIW42144.1 hypothetical protein, variant [Exophiala oligosperma]